MLRLKQNLPAVAVLLMACFVFVSNAHAQERSAAGVQMGGDAISTVVPEVGNIESRINEVTSLITDLGGCGADGQFYDPDASQCHAGDPISIEFTNSGGVHALDIQKPDGNIMHHPLDGVDGVGVNVGSGSSGSSGSGSSGSGSSGSSSSGGSGGSGAAGADNCSMCYAGCSASSSVSIYGSSGACVQAICCPAGCCS